MSRRHHIKSEEEAPASLEESPENAYPEDPQGLLARPGVLGSLPLAEAGVTTLPPGLVIDTGTGPAGWN